MEQKILIQAGTEQLPRAKEYLEQTFAHELVHCILLAMSEMDLNANEKFVDVFSQFLYQSITQSEY